MNGFPNNSEPLPPEQYNRNVWQKKKYSLLYLYCLKVKFYYFKTALYWKYEFEANKQFVYIYIHFNL
jgi:hypothetical protein